MLDNAVWHSLVHAHPRFAERAGAAARYQPDVSVFAAIDDSADSGWDDLATLLGPEHPGALFRPGPVIVPPGWTRHGGGEGHQMVLEHLAAVTIPDARRLGADDVDQMLRLVELTRPGPFCVRTVELGDYFGVFAGRDLIAMAGERLRLPGYCEISAVCTHPDWRGRGLAAGLTALVAQRILGRGDTPFLHHAVDNDPARRVYEALGFVFRRAVEWSVVSSPSRRPGQR